MKPREARSLLTPVKREQALLIPRVIFARHGATAFNSGEGPERVRSWLPIRLNAEGIKEAKELVKQLHDIKINSDILSSHLIRAMQVAQLIRNDHKGSRIIASEEWATWNMPQWAGEKVSKILPKMMKLMFETPDKPAPGGDSWNWTVDRVQLAFRKALTKAIKEVKLGALIVSTHASVLRIIDGDFKEGLDNYRIDELTLRKPNHLETGEALEFKLIKGHWQRSVFMQGKKSGVIS